MRLSDVMSHLNLTIYPIMALVLFITVFAGVCVRTFRPGRRAEFRTAASAPLDLQSEEGGTR